MGTKTRTKTKYRTSRGQNSYSSWFSFSDLKLFSSNHRKKEAKLPSKSLAFTNCCTWVSVGLDPSIRIACLSSLVESVPFSFKSKHLNASRYSTTNVKYKNNKIKKKITWFGLHTSLRFPWTTVVLLATARA